MSAKIYHSKLFKYTINYPAKFELEERFGTVTLKEKNIDGYIMIIMNGTNNNSLTYEEGEQKVIINDLEAKKYRAKYADYQNSSPVEHRGYQFFKDYGIYSLYTNTSVFYDDLDQIAKSFRYEP